MKKILFLILLLSSLFGNSQTFNDLLSLQNKDDIPNDIFDLFIRKGYEYLSTKSNILDIDDCNVYILFKEGTTIEIYHCFDFELPI